MCSTCRVAITPTDPVEALWSSVQSKDEASSWARQHSFPSSRSLPSATSHLWSILLHSWKVDTLTQAVFCKDSRCPQVTKHWVVTHSWLACTVDRGHCDLQASLSPHSILSFQSVVVHFSKSSIDSVDSSLSVNKISVILSSSNSRAQCVHNMDYLRLVNVCLFDTVTGSTNLVFHKCVDKTDKYV